METEDPAAVLLGRNELKAWAVAEKILRALLPAGMTSAAAKTSVFSVTVFLRLINPRRFPILATTRDLVAQESSEWQNPEAVIRDYRVQATKLQRIAIRLNLQDPAGLDDGLYWLSRLEAEGEDIDRLRALKLMMRKLEVALFHDDRFVGQSPTNIQNAMEVERQVPSELDRQQIRELMEKMLPETALVQETLAAIKTAETPRFVEGFTKLLKNHLVEIAKTMVENPNVRNQLAWATGMSSSSIQNLPDNDKCIEIALTPGEPRGNAV